PHILPYPSPLSLHDALPILRRPLRVHAVSENNIYPNVVAILGLKRNVIGAVRVALARSGGHFDDLKPGVESSPLVENGQEEVGRSEEHTSELQSRVDIVCRL